MPNKLFDTEAYLKEVTLMNDYFMNICLDNNIPCAQAMLTRILGRHDLNITKVETQKKLPGLGRELILDVHAEETRYSICGDGALSVYNMEVQNDDRGAGAKRLRYHCGMLDVYHLKKGQTFDELPETYVIFITKNDILKRGKTMYTISRYIDGTNERFEDGQHLVYVNCSAENDGSEIWKLIHDMTCKTAEELLIPELADRVGYFKDTQKGRLQVDEYFDAIFNAERAEGREEGRAEALKKAKREKEGFVSKFIKEGIMTLEKIAEMFEMPLTEVQALARKVKA